MALVLEGKSLAQNIKNNIACEIKKYKEEGKRAPKLVIISTNEDDGSIAYIKAREKVGKQLGIEVQSYHVTNPNNENLKDLIEKLNNDTNVDGIIIDKPYFEGMDETLLNSIENVKDVDGAGLANQGYLFQNKKCNVACTAVSAYRLLKYHNIAIEGSNVLIIGRSLTVGKPLSLLLLNENATITVAHSKTKNLKEIAKRADIIVAAVGKKQLIDEEYVGHNTIIIDVGVHYNDDGSMVGDVNSERIKDIVKGYSPVPGGVGSLTTAILMENVLNSYKERMR